jgi:replicative DNA helicase
VAIGGISLVIRERIEEIILAACIKSKKAAMETSESLVDSDFTTITNRKIYRIVCNAVNSNAGYSRVAVINEMEKELIDKNYIADLLSKTVPLDEDFAYLVSQIKEASERDSIDDFANMLKAYSADENRTLDEIRSALSSAVDIITPSVLKTGHSMSDVNDAILQEIDCPRGRVLSGFLQLDAITGGFTKKEFAVLAGLPGTGKSTCALAMTYNMARNGIPVAFYGFEMAKEKMGEKLLAHHANIPYFILDKKPPAEIERWRESIVKATTEMNQLPIYMCDESTVPNVDRLEESIRYMVSKHNVEMVVVDYLQQINVPGIKDEFASVTEVAKRLKKIAKMNNVFILAVSQMSRDFAKDQERLPRSSDLRSSGQIEQEAAYIIFVVRRKYGKEFKATGMKHKFSIPYYEASFQLTKNRFSGEADITCDQIIFSRTYAKYVNAFWDDTTIKEYRCPNCQSPQIYYGDKRIKCSSCGFEEMCVSDQVKNGLIFKNRIINVYGKDFNYDFAFLYDGYQGDTIHKHIKKMNSLLADASPIRRLKMADLSPMEPIGLSDVMGEVYEF